MKKLKEKTKETEVVSANQDSKEEQKRSRHSKVFTIIGIVMCVILVPILIINVTMIIKSYTNPDKYPSFAGFNMMIVLSPSMEDTIMTGDLIVVKNADPADVKGESEPGKGDGTVISFFDPDSRNNAVLTHRCVEVTTDKDGNLAFKTKGDNNNSDDPTLCPAENLIGIYQFRIPGAGNIAMWLQTTPGLIVCIAVPVILLVGYDLIMKKRYDKTKKKDTDALLAELEALRAQAAQNGADGEKPAEAAPVQKAEPAPAEAPVKNVAVNETAPVTEKGEAVAEKAADSISDIDSLVAEIEGEEKQS